MSKSLKVVDIMTNNLIFHIIFLAVLLTGNNIYASTFLLRCMTTNMEEGTKIELSYTVLKENKWIDIVDSTKVTNGEFVFQGYIEGVTAARLDFSNRFICIYIEPTQMQLCLDGNKPYRYRLEGTTVERENVELRKQLQPYMEFYFELLDSVICLSNRIYTMQEGAPMKDSLYHSINNVVAINKANHNKMDRIRWDFSLKHPSFQIIPNLLYSISERGTICIDSVRSVYNKLPELTKNSIMGQLALKEIEEQEDRRDLLKRTSIGNASPNFIRKNISGDMVELANYKNKTFVLLDFWASWCMPCLKEIPKMKEVYKKYNEKGLTIIGISLDRVKDSWSEAIRKYNLNVWPQILSSETNEKDEKENNLSYLYNCDAIPFYVLIDKEGKVVAKWEHIGDVQLKELDMLIK